MKSSKRVPGADEQSVRELQADIDAAMCATDCGDVERIELGPGSEVTALSRPTRLLVLSAFSLALAGCASESWDGRIRIWGTMREALREGHTEARVSLSEVTAAPNAFGVGALEALAGEVTILDGRVWLARVAESGRIDTKQMPQGDRSTSATLLAAAHVSAWQDTPIEHVLALERLEEFVGDQGARAGLDAVSGFPFLIEGEFAALKLHVVNGACPFSGAGDGEEPARAERSSVRGTLVGFFYAGEPGVLTHHGSRTHIHVLITGDRAISGHVEAVAVAATATLRLPVSQKAREARHRVRDAGCGGGLLSSGAISRASPVNPPVIMEQAD